MKGTCSGTSKNVQSACRCSAYVQWHNNHFFKSHHNNVICPPAMYCVSRETGAMQVTNKIAVFRMDIDSKYSSQYFTYKNVIIISKTLYNQKYNLLSYTATYYIRDSVLGGSMKFTLEVQWSKTRHHLPGCLRLCTVA